MAAVDRSVPRSRLSPSRCRDPASDGGCAAPARMSSREVVMVSSCGMYSSIQEFGIAQTRLTCSSIRKCGQTGRLKRLGQMRDLEPGRDAADAGHIDLHDGGGAERDVILELAGRIQAFAHGDRHAAGGAPAGRGRSTSSAGIGSSNQTDAVIGQHVGAQQRLVIGERLIGIDHQAEAVAHRRAHGRQAGGILGQMGPADLELGPGETLRLAPPAASATRASVSRCSQPPSVE